MTNSSTLRGSRYIDRFGRTVSDGLLFIGNQRITETVFKLSSGGPGAACLRNHVAPDAHE